MTKISKADDNRFFGQPLGLLNLFSTEFCERFSYYGMRAILVFYIYAAVADGGLGLTKQDALFSIGIFGSCVYLLTVVGGWLADRILGSYNAVFFGGIVIAAGHVVLSLPVAGVVGTFVALALICFGTGFLKPNISQMVGELYDENDRRRNAGFNLFVMGINLGSLFSPLITGFVQKTAGYHIAFSIPTILMFVGLFVYRGLSKRTLANISKLPPNPLSKAEAQKFGVITIIAVIALIILLIVLNAFGLATLDTFSIVLPLISVGIVIYMIGSMILDKELTKIERNRVIAYIAVFWIGAIFWAIEELQPSVFAVLADSRADNHVGGFEVPAAWYQSINPFVIIILAPILALLWTKWKKQPSAFIKMVFGLGLTAVSFIIPGVTFAANSHGETISPLLLIIPIIMFSVAEMFISPIGLSFTTGLAPNKYKSRMMSLWFLNSAVALGMNSFCVRFFDEDNPSNFFFGYAAVTVVIIVVILALLKPLQRLASESII